ncbi:MAG: hypothetical protein NC452_10055 [Eubacterium sp.]|nr:hypothetical protein [Eubacterium sp.]
MKKREFRDKAARELLKKLVDTAARLNENPNISVSPRYSNMYFKLRKTDNLIQISIKQMGEFEYQLTDLIGYTVGKQTYYRYNDGDDFESVIKKFVKDFGRLYKDLIKSGTFHGFIPITLAYEQNTDEALEEYEKYGIL